MPNIRIYGLPTTSKIAIDLEDALCKLPKPEAWRDRTISPTTIDSRSGGTLRLDVIFVDRNEITVQDLADLKRAVLDTACAFLHKHRQGHDIRRVVVRMLPTPAHLYEVVEP